MDTINQICLTALPGYAPRGTKDRAGQARLSPADLDAALGEFIVKVYNHRVHSETGQPPQARWEAGGFLPRLPESLEQLDLPLLTVAKPCKIHPDGIRFQGLRYLDPVLAAYVGESVIIRYDPRDLAEIRVFHRGRFLGRAICPVRRPHLAPAQPARRHHGAGPVGPTAQALPGGVSPAWTLRTSGLISSPRSWKRPSRIPNPPALTCRPETARESLVIGSL